MAFSLRFMCLAAILSCSPVSGDSGYEFEFARIRYQGFGDWPRWQADWPEAETHFTGGLSRLTRISTSPDGQVLTLDQDKIFDYPWLYVVEVGYMSLSPNEVENLREYLLRGGFLMVDDFHGYYEWENFESLMAKVFPDRPIERLDGSSEEFQVLYDLNERLQVPGIRAVMSGRTWEKGGVKPGWLGIKDDQGRTMVAINFNQDIGDGWEHADDAMYPEPFTAMAYRLGVNYVVYAMTH